MRILFVGGVEMGRACAEKLLLDKFGIAGIFCLPQSQSHRSGYADFSPLGKKYGVPVFKYDDINHAEAVEKIRQLAPDVIVLIGWSGIIGEEILAIPKRGVLGHHPTLLPRHRGNAPIPWTLINGLSRSGVTLFFLEKEIDKGDIAGQKEFSITLEDDAASVYAKATKATIELLPKVLRDMEAGKLVRIPQDPRKASRWGKRKPEDGIIDWNCMAVYLHNWVRGLTHPYPGAFTFHSGKKLFIWKAKITPSKSAGNAAPGTVLESGKKLVVKCGDGALEILKLQPEGGKETGASSSAASLGLKKGDLLG